MAALDRQLKALALAAQQQPPGSDGRQRALAALLHQLRSCGKLARPHNGKFRGCYEEIYWDALQRLCLHICERIDRYDGDREVLQGANFLLRRRFFVEACYEFFPHYQVPMSDPDDRPLPWLSLDDLEDWHPRYASYCQQTPSLVEQVRQCLEDDPEGVFRATHLSGRPDISFQYLACQLLAGYKWQELAENLDLPLSTLSSFYQRSLKRLAPYLRQYLAPESADAAEVRAGSFKNPVSGRNRVG